MFNLVISMTFDYTSIFLSVPWSICRHITNLQLPHNTCVACPPNDVSPCNNAGTCSQGITGNGTSAYPFVICYFVCLNIWLLHQARAPAILRMLVAHVRYLCVLPYSECWLNDCGWIVFRCKHLQWAWRRAARWHLYLSKQLWWPHLFRVRHQLLRVLVFLRLFLSGSHV